MENKPSPMFTKFLLSYLKDTKVEYEKRGYIPTLELLINDLSDIIKDIENENTRTDNK